MQEFDGQGKWGGEEEANGDDEEDDEEDQVWPLAQFNSVGFSQLKICVKSEVCESCFYCVLGQYYFDLLRIHQIIFWF